MEWKAPIYYETENEVWVRAARIGRSSLTYLLEVHPKGQAAAARHRRGVWVCTVQATRKAPQCRPRWSGRFGGSKASGCGSADHRPARIAWTARAHRLIGAVEAQGAMASCQAAGELQGGIAEARPADCPPRPAAPARRHGADQSTAAPNRAPTGATARSRARPSTSRGSYRWRPC